MATDDDEWRRGMAVVVKRHRSELRGEQISWAPREGTRRALKSMTWMLKSYSAVVGSSLRSTNTSPAHGSTACAGAPPQIVPGPVKGHTRDAQPGRTRDSDAAPLRG